MTGFFLVFPLRAPVVVRMITGRPPSSPPSAPPVASYRATWSRTRSLGLGTYCAPRSAPVAAAVAAGSASVLSFMWASPAFALVWVGWRTGAQTAVRPPSAAMTAPVM